MKKVFVTGEWGRPDGLESNVYANTTVPVHVKRWPNNDVYDVRTGRRTPDDPPQSLDWNDDAKQQHYWIMKREIREYKPDVIVCCFLEDAIAGNMSELSNTASVLCVNREAARMENDRAYAKRVALNHSVCVTESCSLGSSGAIDAVLPIMRDWQGCALKFNVSNGRDVKTEIYETAEECVSAIRVRPEYKFPSTVEELVRGCEVSFSVLVDYRTNKIVPICTDFEYTKFGTGDVGCETSEMGSHVIAGVGRMALVQIFDKLIPWFREVKYIGWFNASCMYNHVTGRLSVFEFMTRLGRCEFEIVMNMMASDFSEVVDKLCKGTLEDKDIRWDDRHGVGVGVVDSYGMVNGGHESFEVTGPIHSLMKGCLKGSMFSRVNCRFDSAGKMRTNGPFVYNAIGTGPTVGIAKKRAYDVTKSCRFPGAYYRTDIGHRYENEETRYAMVENMIIDQ